MGATITLGLDEWNQLNADKQSLANELAEMKQKLADANLEALSGSGDTTKGRQLDTLVRSAVDVVRFAVANLPPECTPGWPVVALLNVAENIEALPTYTDIDRDLRIELLAFAKTAEEHETRRYRSKS